MTNTFDIVEVSLVGIRLHRLLTEESIGLPLTLCILRCGKLRPATLNISPHLNEHDTRLLTNVIQASC